jgi:hypothetical protein
MLDLFSGRWGWSKAFAARGWECIGVDLVEPAEIPAGCRFLQRDVLRTTSEWVAGMGIDFACASSPCEEFSVWGMRHFHPNPKYPENGIRLFNRTRSILEASGVPYVMENVRAAQRFVGNAVHHCGPFYLWGNAVPPLLTQGIKKGFKLGNGAAARILKETGDRTALREYRKRMDCWYSSKSPHRIANMAKVATIPIELANCVADYAERILEQARK